MNADWINTASLQLCIFLTGLLSCYVESASYYGGDYGGDYYGGGADYGGVDYGGNVPQVGKRKQDPYQYTYDKEDYFECYACHYEVNGKEITGTANCDDPFNKYGIESVRCSTYCAKFRKQMNDKDDNDYSLTRLCLPKCEDMSDGLEYRECCNKDKCNGAVPSRSVSSSVTLLTLLTALLSSLFLNS